MDSGGGRSSALSDPTTAQAPLRVEFDGYTRSRLRAMEKVSFWFSSTVSYKQ
jgi:hypothetical protein